MIDSKHSPKTEVPARGTSIAPGSAGLCPGGVEVSVVMPCLNEEDTVGTCVEKAVRAGAALETGFEVVVADNGSTDRSREIALAAGARVVQVKEKGYGHALMQGIQAARGQYVIMGDADDSYDFLELAKFVTKLREGYDLVQGCRLPRGGGTVCPGAMPWLHRWWGNPMFSLMARWWFDAPINDVYCGLRGFRKSFQQGLNQMCTGMEFATEMIIKASLRDARISEVPISLHPDGRKSHPPHLKTFRDGWRTLRFFLLFSPRWLFLMPGILLILLGIAGYAVALPGFKLGGVTFDAHTLLFASMSLLCGYQTVVFAVFVKAFAIGEGILPASRRVEAFFRIVNLERGLMASVGILLVGLTLLILAVNQWRLADFGRLDYARTMRLVIPGATLTTIAIQTIFSSFFVSVLGLQRR
jgi:glycosyltransferase involved in cell wall biosynthesis